MFKHILVPTDGSQPVNRYRQARDRVRQGEPARKSPSSSRKPDYPVAFYGEGALIDPTTPEKFAEMAEQQAQEILVRREAAGAGGRR